MPHLTDTWIIRFVAGELPSPDAEAARSHIESCAACRVRVREQERLWAALGAWNAEEVVPDVAGAVFARIDGEDAERSWERPRSMWRPVRWAQVGRLAASVLVAAGVGHALARWTSRVGTNEAAGPAAVTSAEVVGSLGLDVFAWAPAGLADAVDTVDDEADSPGGRS